MNVFPEDHTPEETRLKYRFLDLRRSKLHQTVMLRAKVISSIRRRMIELGFQEFQTPDPHLVLARGRARFPRALAPLSRRVLRAAAGAAAVQAAPHGQRLRPLFPDRALLPRRGWPRRPHPGEFYQLDVEMSFVTQDDVFAAMEALFVPLFREFKPDWPMNETAARSSASPTRTRCCATAPTSPTCAFRLRSAT